MALFDSRTARIAAYKRNLYSYGGGRYIVAYKLNRKNAARHECFRSDKLSDCMDYIMNHHYTDRYFTIYDYNWKEIKP